MPRAKKGFKARRRRNRILKVAKGFQQGRGRLWRTAVEAVRKSWVYAYAHRRLRKRDFRRLWIARINAATRLHGLSYSRFIAGLTRANIQIDRKVLSDLAITEPQAFAKVVEQARAGIAAAG
jgi:large subunit ribosomal protein L20